MTLWAERRKLVVSMWSAGLVVLALSLGTVTAAAQTSDDDSDPNDGAAGTPTSALYLDVGNPSPGDSVHIGRYVIHGIAFDRAAEVSPGIDHIDIFLDDRDSGGVVIGHGMLGAPDPQPDDPDLAGSGWVAQVDLSRRMLGPHTMFFYALSAVTGDELVVGVPVTVVP